MTHDRAPAGGVAAHPALPRDPAGGAPGERHPGGAPAPGPPADCLPPWAAPAAGSPRAGPGGVPLLRAAAGGRRAASPAPALRRVVSLAPAAQAHRLHPGSRAHMASPACGEWMPQWGASRRWCVKRGERGKNTSQITGTGVVLPLLTYDRLPHADGDDAAGCARTQGPAHGGDGRVHDPSGGPDGRSQGLGVRLSGVCTRPVARVHRAPARWCACPCGGGSEPRAEGTRACGPMGSTHTSGPRGSLDRPARRDGPGGVSWLTQEGPRSH